MSKLYCEACDQVYNAPQSVNLEYPRAPKTKTCSDCGATLVPYEFPKQTCVRFTSAREMSEAMKSSKS